MEPFGPAPHHDILLLVVRIGALLLAARLLGDLSQRLGQPSVLGELLAGILLGPSVLGGISPQLAQVIVPQTDQEGYLLSTISLLGAMFLLLITGLETDLALIKRHARTALGVSLGGIAATFLAGFAVGMMLPADLLPAEVQRPIAAMAIATAISIAAISVVAKVLIDLDLVRRDVGQTLIAAGLCDDVLGWMLLSVVAGLAAGDGISVGSLGKTVGQVSLFMVFSFTIGRWLVKRALELVQDKAVGRDPSLSLVIVLTFLWGGITQWLHLESVLGAFVMGILFGQMKRLPSTVHHQLESIALGIFAPIFFATAGLKVNLRELLEPRLLAVTAVVLLVALGGKIVGTYLGARLIGRKEHWSALSFGAGLNARGGTDIIIATVGLSLGLLTATMFSIVVLVAMISSLLTPTALRWVLKRVEPTEDELERLRTEELAAGSLVAGIHRVLIPVRSPAKIDQDLTGEPEIVYTRALEAGLLRRLALGQELEVTLFSIATPETRPAAEKYLEQLRTSFKPLKPALKVSEGTQPSEAILAEASRHYDLLILGASQQIPNTESVFNPIVDNLMRFAPCPTMVVKGRRSEPHWPPERILVRANGTEAARHAAEMAFALAGEETEVILLHVVVPPTDTYYLDAGGRELDRQLGIGHQIVDSMRELAAGKNVRIDPEVRIGRAEDLVMLDVSEQRNVDLIVVGTHLRPASEKLYLGVRVERLLREAPCPVVVVNSS